MAIANGDPCVILQGDDGLPVAFGVPSVLANGDPCIIVQGADGLPVAFVFAQEVPCEIDGEQVPEMLLTVAGVVTATVNWCGQTWNLPDDSGQQKSACPATYVKSRGTAVTTYGTVNRRLWYAANFWAYNNLNGTGLVLGRSYALSNYATVYTPTNPTFYRRPFGSSNQNLLHLFPTAGGGGPQDRTWLFATWTLQARPIPATYTAVYNSTIGKLAQTDASYGNYNIGANFFGNYTSGGITYTWAKGEGWP